MKGIDKLMAMVNKLGDMEVSGAVVKCNETTAELRLQMWRPVYPLLELPFAVDVLFDKEQMVIRA